MTTTPGKRESYSHALAGGVAGSVAVLMLHPFDVIKTRLQVQDGHQAQHLTYRSALDAAQNMYRREGWRAFYNGLAPAWLGSGVAWAAYFYTYERIKGLYLSLSGGERLGTLWTTLSAAQAGAVVCLLTNPIWLIKTRLQLQQQHKAVPQVVRAQATAAAAGAAAAGAAAATAAAARPTVGAAGLPAAGAAHQSAARSSQPSTSAPAASGSGASGSAHEPPKPHATQGPSQGPAPSAAQAAARSFAKAELGPSSAAAAAAATAGAAKPASAAASSSAPYRGMLDAFIRIGREEGVRGYYKGLAPSLVLQTCHGAIQFTVYEELKHLLSSRARDWGPVARPPPQPSSPSPQTPPHHRPAPALISEAPLGEPFAAAPSTGLETAPPLPSTSAPSAALPLRALSSLELSLCAISSKLAASVLTYPSQVVRSRLQQRFVDRDLVYRGAIQTVVLTWRNEGLRGFYRGLGPALLRTLPQSALTLTVYEKVLTLMPAAASSWEAR